MTTYAITRHGGALDWIISKIPVDVVLGHLTPTIPFKAGDCVVGLLPAHMVANLCAQGVRYFHLSLDVPPHLRGVELTIEQMNAYNARLLELDIKIVRTI